MSPDPDERMYPEPDEPSEFGLPRRSDTRYLDRLMTQLQETSECNITGLTLMDVIVMTTELALKPEDCLIEAIGEQTYLTVQKS